jgi:iron complex outermembrane receptor protein
MLTLADGRDLSLGAFTNNGTLELGAGSTLTVGGTYAQASRGFKAGTFNVRANERRFPQSALPLEDESVTALELGAKGRWLEGRLELNAALFHNRYQDIQLSVFTAYDSNGDGADDSVFGDFRNAGEGTTRGMELEWTWLLGRFLRWRAHAGYLDTRYDHFYSGGVDLADGKRFANAPRWNAGNSLVLDLPLRGGGWLLARIDGRLQAKVYPTTELDEAMAQPAYAVWNASLAWTSPQQRWQVALRGENLGDTAYRVTGFSFPTLGILSGHYGPPRNWSLSLRWSY